MTMRQVISREVAGHTPGPWRQQYPEWNLIQTGASLTVAKVQSLSVGMVEQVRDKLDAESIANARLIAAAPEMLEALREMVAGFNFAVNNGLTAKLIEHAQAAIAKAEGRP